jgi:DNA-directed RNA polymerase subunit B
MSGENIGLPIVGSYLAKGDCVIGAYKEIGTGTEKTKIDLPSEYIRIGEEGIVSDVWTTYSKDGKWKVITVKLYRYRVAIEGDKFSPRNAQKGTAGRIQDERDMPFLAEYGITPDMIINPHQIISRMTLSYLLEVISSTYTAITGERVDASPFRSGQAAKVIGEELRKRGFNQFGYASFVHGKTGEVIPVMVFSGPVFFQTFKHTVEGKYQSYGNKGHRQPGTYSVTKGRKHEGTIRTGHMEGDALNAHGVTAKVRDILCNSADKVNMPLCMRCGYPATWNRVGVAYMCTACGDKNSIGMVDMPYSIRYFQLILAVAGISLTPVVDTVVNYNKKNSITCEDIAYTGALEGTAGENPETEVSRSDSEGDADDELVLHEEDLEQARSDEDMPEEEPTYD